MLTVMLPRLLRRRAHRRETPAPARRRTRPAALAVLGAATLVLVGACADAGTGDQPQAAQNPPELAQFYDQQLQWGPCNDYAPTADDAQTYADPQFDCTRVTVPQDYARPGDGKTMQIALLRKKATGAKIVDVRGYGERMPVASNRTAGGMQKNRRVEIICIR